MQFYNIELVGVALWGRNRKHKHYNRTLGRIEKIDDSNILNIFTEKAKEFIKIDNLKSHTLRISAFHAEESTGGLVMRSIFPSCSIPFNQEVLL